MYLFIFFFFNVQNPYRNVTRENRNYFFSVAHVGDHHHSVQFGVRDRPRRVLGAEQFDSDHLVDTGLRVRRDLCGRHASSRTRR